jgi:GlpG protein
MNHLPFHLQLLQTPVVAFLLVMSILGALITSNQWGNAYFHLFTFQDSLKQGEFLQKQWWRLITPIFLHFGLFHVLFNSLWMWDLGRKLELMQGKLNFIFFVVSTAIFSNYAQYYWTGTSNFGGMSGVVYALVGFIAVRQRLAPHPLLQVPNAIIGFMLFWLVLCMTGVVDYFIAGSVANAAHLGGFIAGAVYAFLSLQFYKR